MKLEYLYLGEAACAPCGETAQTLETAAEATRLPLEAMGIRFNIEKKHITTRALATAERLVSSPTIRVDGVDIAPAVTEDDCPSCGALARDDTKVNCRVWHCSGRFSLRRRWGKSSSRRWRGNPRRGPHPFGVVLCGYELSTTTKTAAPRKTMMPPLWA